MADRGPLASRVRDVPGNGGADVLDVIIRGGTVMDGTGSPGRRADVGVAGGRIVAVGTVEDLAVTTVDADGLFVTPGFVDLHTHYDAQLAWDPWATPSPLHGVTTVIGGNCGFSLAPSAPEHTDYLSQMMAKVEGMPLAALERLDWGWDSFGSWLGRFDHGIGLNAGFLVGHSTLRRAVMGEDAIGVAATEVQVAAMVALAERSFSEGALGFSTSQAHTHNDGSGHPVPSRAATRPEFEALCASLAGHPGTTLELILPGCLDGFTEDEVELMATLSLLANRPVNWNVLGVSALNPSGCERQLDASTVAAQRGATVVALTLPHTVKIRLSFEHGAVIDGLPGWGEIFALPIPERMAALADPEVRRRLDAGAHSEEAGILAALAHWSHLVIDETFSEANVGLSGRTVGSVATERGLEPFDALIEVALADKLRTGLRPSIPESEADWRLRAKVWEDPRAVVGGSDAGAHLDMMCGAIYSTSMLGDGVRKRGLLSWESAIHQLTDVPARLYGLKDRGRVEVGWWADLVLLDPERVGQGPEHTRDDLPGGASRLYAEADGIEHVLVNGVEIVSAGAITGSLPGVVLRSGTDTETVTVPRGAHT
jgi:N-acyl-D-aspartate/D-glutamate deacylase